MIMCCWLFICYIKRYVGSCYMSLPIININEQTVINILIRGHLKFNAIIVTVFNKSFHPYRFCFTLPCISSKFGRFRQQFPLQSKFILIRIADNNMRFANSSRNYLDMIQFGERGFQARFSSTCTAWFQRFVFSDCRGTC